MGGIVLLRGANDKLWSRLRCSLLCALYTCMGKNVGFPRLTRLKFVIHTPKTIPPFSGRLELEAKILIHKLINFTHPYPVALGVNKSPGFYFHTRKRRFLRRKERVCKSQGGGCRKPSLAADPGEGPGGPAPSYFYTKLRPEGPKTFFWRLPPPYLRVWMTGPPLSGSATFPLRRF